MRNRSIGKLDSDVIVLSIDYDGCGDVLSDVIPPAISHIGHTWPAVVDIDTLTERPMTPHLRAKRDEFWRIVHTICSNRRPNIIMSGSARLVYQDPARFEQDAVDHMAVLDRAIQAHGFGRLDHNSNPNRGKIRYDANSIPWNADEEVRSKMSIVREQMRYVRRRFPNHHIRFIFIDDIYATKLENELSRRSLLLPLNVSLHLVHFQSFSSVGSSITASVVCPGVKLWS